MSPSLWTRICNIIFQKCGEGVEGRLEFFQKFIRLAKASMEASYFCKGVYGYCDGYDGTCGYCWDFTFINIVLNREETPPLVLGKQQLSWSWKRKSWSCLFLYISYLSILSPLIVLHLAILRAWLLGFKFSNHKWVFHHCTLLSLAGNFVALQVFSFVALREVEILDLSHPSFNIRTWE